jgi:hypothetical protein
MNNSINISSPSKKDSGNTLFSGNFSCESLAVRISHTHTKNFCSKSKFFFSPLPKYGLLTAGCGAELCQCSGELGQSSSELRHGGMLFLHRGMLFYCGGMLFLHGGMEFLHRGMFFQGGGSPRTKSSTELSPSSRPHGTKTI